MHPRPPHFLTTKRRKQTNQRMKHKHPVPSFMSFRWHSVISKQIELGFNKNPRKEHLKKIIPMAFRAPSSVWYDNSEIGHKDLRKLFLNTAVTICSAVHKQGYCGIMLELIPGKITGSSLGLVVLCALSAAMEMAVEKQPTWTVHQLCRDVQVAMRSGIPTNKPNEITS